MIKITAATILAFSAILSSGCTSVPMASQESNKAAKTFAVKQDKANIYIYRNEGFGAAVKLALTLNGRLVADTGAKTFALIEVNPGKYTLVSKSANEPSITFETIAGKNYFIWQEMKMGAFGANSALHIVDETTGMAGVTECDLTQSVTQ